jgi:hypothetical protein
MLRIVTVTVASSGINRFEKTQACRWNRGECQEQTHASSMRAPELDQKATMTGRPTVIPEALCTEDWDS